MQLSAEAVATIAKRAGFAGPDLVIAVAVARGESSFRTDALGDTGSIRGLTCPSHGLWQIRSCPGVKGGMNRGTREQLIDPDFNAQAARRLRATPRGWNHWTVYSNGAYKRYLTEAEQAVRNIAAGGVGIPNTGKTPAPTPDTTGPRAPGMGERGGVGSVGDAFDWIGGGSGIPGILRVGLVVGGGVAMAIGAVILARAVGLDEQAAKLASLAPMGKGLKLVKGAA